MSVTVQPTYASINLVRDLAEPWIELWGGDEWGESMRDLHGACHTSYGFTDEDCALFATKLFENLQAQREWMDEEGQPAYGLSPPEEEAKVQERCREIREYWSKDVQQSQAAKETLEAMPGWIFGE